MAFEIGDTVLYGIDGVCKITDIVRKNFKGRMINYYVLHPVFNDRSVLYVPKDNEESVARMRHALTSRQIKLIFKKTPTRECKWIENENERKAYFKEVLYDGDKMIVQARLNDDIRIIGILWSRLICLNIFTL